MFTTLWFGDTFALIQHHHVDSSSCNMLAGAGNVRSVRNAIKKLGFNIQDVSNWSPFGD
jgi:predicted ATP-grasp superfamily ATP-dependent carboligase